VILSNDKQNPAIRLDEKTHGEEPVLAQLADLGWEVIRLGQKEVPFVPRYASVADSRNGVR